MPSVTNSDSDVSGNTIVTEENNYTITGTWTFSTAPVLPANTVDAITEIAAALKSGSDATLITGTAGTNGNLAQWNADGDLVDGPTPPSGSFVGTTDTQTLTNKTLTTPTIGDFTNSTHDHSNAAGGGNIPITSVTRHYGELYGNTQTTETISVQNTYVVVTALDTDGVSNGVTLDSTTNNDITVARAGHYRVDYSITYSGPASVTIETAVHVDGSEVAKTRRAEAGIGAGTDEIATISCSAILDLTAGTEAVDLRVRNITSTANVTVEDVTLVLTELAAT